VALAAVAVVNPQRDRDRLTREHHAVLAADDAAQNLLLPQQERWPLDPTKPVIELVDVSLSFGPKQVLSGLTLAIVPRHDDGDRRAQAAPGSRSCSKLMMGLLRPTSGRVDAVSAAISRPLSPVEVLELRKRMGMLFQNYALFDALNRRRETSGSRSSRTLASAGATSPRSPTT